MSLSYFIQLLLFVILMCSGQILFKKTAIELATMGINNSNNLLYLLFNVLKIPYFFIALFIYGFATFYWLYLLQKIPLSLAYPFTALAMVIIPILSVYIFKEAVNLSYWIGAFLIFLGIIIISLKGVN